MLITLYVIISILFRKPVFNLPGFKKPAISIRFSPVAYKSTSSNPYIGLKDYKLIYAVTTQDSCLIYDTSQVSPICLVGNLHYSGLTDMSWFVLFSLRFLFFLA